ncbi:MAG: hypothetical protein QOF47_1468, partial [Mycobacterium sp.]|nr:hypothetical protein [Mycobacterium sp.]
NSRCRSNEARVVLDANSLASATVPPSEPISVCAFALVGAGETSNSLESAR